MAPDDFADPLTARIVGFLRGLGFGVETAVLDGDTFLPGIAVTGGRLRVDPARLAWPGDLLHEAGHLAVSDPTRLDDGVSDDPGEEMAALAWSFAAATHLGLALTKSLVEMHDGALEMTSSPGEGTTVSFVLPINQSGLTSLRDFAAA